VPAQVAHNPAERLLDQPIEDSVYAPATRKKQPGMVALTLLAPDSLGNPQALARRMGVEEMMFDSVGHINHLHIGLTRAAAARRTSFWSAAR
jgi:hypothetical protein